MSHGVGSDCVHGRARVTLGRRLVGLGRSRRKVDCSMALPVAVEPPHSTGVAILTPDHLASSTSTYPTNIVILPCLLRQLTAIQLHMLGRVATHCWTHGGRIPYVPPNAHQ